MVMRSSRTHWNWIDVATTSIVRRRITIVSLDGYGIERIVHTHTTGTTGIVVGGDGNIVFDPPQTLSPQQHILKTQTILLLLLPTPTKVLKT